MGYRIALDDFGTRPELWDLVDIADFVKVDLRAISDSELEMQAKALKSRGVQLVAEKVETREEHKRCRALGSCT